MKNECRLGVFALIVMLISLFPQSAQAYVGPGAGLSAIGAFLAVLAGIVVAIFGFVWYPMKRLLRTLRKKKNEVEDKADQ